jgi:hypothetical protein
MKFIVEKGRMLAASCHWVHFILRNTDVMTTLNKAPLTVTQLDDRHYNGNIFGVTIEMEMVGDSEPKPDGEVFISTDVRMPMRLGKTHARACYRYRLVDASVTMVDLELKLQTSGMIMGLYAAWKRRHIDAYLNHVLGDNERAAILVQQDDPLLKVRLSAAQQERVARFRAKYGETLQGIGIRESKLSSQVETVAKEFRVWDAELSELTSLYQTFRGQARALEDELVRIRETRDAVATLLIARRMLEVIVATLCQAKLKRPRGTDPLAGIIDKLGGTQSVPDYVLTSMKNLNGLSTYGAHPKEFSPRQVREALIALCSIMEWYAQFTLNQKEGGT